MFIIKEYYYLYIDNTKSINLELFKQNYKFTIIYRNSHYKENINEIIRFKKYCDIKKIKFYVANNYKLAKECKADGLYLSSHNKKIYHNINTIGSAHTHKEINQKIKQKCEIILLSRLFKTTYLNKKDFYGVIKFNLIVKKYNVKIFPLGGIRYNNLLKLNLINSTGFAIMSEIKKKPAISNRLF